MNWRAGDKESRKVPLEGSGTFAKNVERVLLRVQTRLSTGESTLGGKPYACEECGTVFITAQTLSSTKELTLGRSPVSVMTVGRPLARAAASLNITDSTQAEAVPVQRMRQSL